MSIPVMDGLVLSRKSDYVETVAEQDVDGTAVDQGCLLQGPRGETGRVIGAGGGDEGDVIEDPDDLYEEVD